MYEDELKKRSEEGREAGRGVKLNVAKQQSLKDIVQTTA